MKETLKGYAFPPLLLSSLQMVLKVILKIACKATKVSKYLSNTMQFIFTQSSKCTSQYASQKCQSRAEEKRKVHLKTKQKENNDSEEKEEAFQQMVHKLVASMKMQPYTLDNQGDLRAERGDPGDSPKSGCRNVLEENGLKNGLQSLDASLTMFSEERNWQKSHLFLSTYYVPGPGLSISCVTSFSPHGSGFTLTFTEKKHRPREVP